MEIKTVSKQELETSYLNLSFPNPPTDRPYVYLNMVSSFDGVIDVRNPQTGFASEQGLGSQSDKKVMQLLRAHADAVLNGSLTLKLSGSGSEISDEALRYYRAQKGKKPNPMAVVLSFDGTDLPLEKEAPHSSFFYTTEFEKILFITSAASTEIIEKIKATTAHCEVIPNSETNVREMLKILKEKYQVDYLVCEGGPGINGSLLSNQLVDEFFLTFSPKIVGGGKHPVEIKEPFTLESLVELEPISNYFLEETGESFLHYKVK